MLTSNQLIKLAEELENPENPALEKVEEDEELDKVAESLVRAASYLRMAADEMAEIEPDVEGFTEEKLEQIAALAEAFSESDDELLQKQASMLDDLLITLGSPKNAFLFSEAKDGDRIAELKKKYNDTAEELREKNKISEALKEVEKSEVYKQPKDGRPLQYSLSTRTCINHPGASLQRIAEGQVRCSLGGEVMDYNEGFTTEKGVKIPGATVQEQGIMDGQNSFTAFDTDTRASRMGFNQDQGSGNTP